MKALRYPMSEKKSLNPRQQGILEHIEAKGMVTLEELQAEFPVSAQTLRKDLSLLAEQSPIERFHGGASWPSSTQNLPYQERQIINQPEKEAIADSLVQHIPNGSSLFINIGTTTEAIARALLQHSNLQIITNNLHVARILYPKTDFRVIVASGEVRPRDGGIVGEATIDFIQQFRLDFGIVGISAIDTDGALLDYDYREVRVAQTIIQQSRQVLLAADHTKFQREAMVQLGHITQANHVFTDQQPSRKIRALLAEKEIPVHICTSCR